MSNTAMLTLDGEPIVMKSMRISVSMQFQDKDNSGQTSATFTKASAVSGDAGVYSCVVTDADGTVITSSDCTVTIN